MTDDLALTVAPVSRVAVQVQTADIIALKNILDPGMSDAELRLLAAYAQRTGLDPISKQIYSSHIDGKQVIMVAIDGFRVVAERSGKYRGQGPVVYGDNCSCGNARYRVHPEWSESSVYRADFEAPLVRRAYFHEFVPVPMSGNYNNWNRDNMWVKMPRIMLGKCAEAQALRAAFPNDLGSMYISEEMDQAAERQAVDVTMTGTLTYDAEARGQLPAPSSEDEPRMDYQGPVYEAPDGVRSIKPPAWAPAGTEDPVGKAELKFKIGSRRHTAMLLGPLAYAAVEANIQADEVVAMDGELVEIEWQAGKPKKKELHRVTQVYLMRGGEWQRLGDAGPEPPEGLVEAAEAIFEEVPIPGGSSPDGPPIDITEAATPPPASAPTDDADDLAALAGDLLPGEAAILEPPPAEPAAPAPDISKAMSRTVWANEADKGMDMEAAVLEVTEGTTSNGSTYAHGWLMHLKDPVRFEFVLSGDEAKAQNVYALVPGQVVRIVGTWAKAAGRTVVLATAIVAA